MDSKSILLFVDSSFLIKLLMVGGYYVISIFFSADWTDCWCQASSSKIGQEINTGPTCSSRLLSQLCFGYRAGTNSPLTSCTRNFRATSGSLFFKSALKSNGAI